MSIKHKWDLRGSIQAVALDYIPDKPKVEDS